MRMKKGIMKSIACVVGGIALIGAGTSFSFVQYRKSATTSSERDVSRYGILPEQFRPLHDPLKSDLLRTAQRYADMPQGRALSLVLANDAYRAADAVFWDFVLARQAGKQRFKPDLFRNRDQYAAYHTSLDAFTRDGEDAKSLLWQAWNNKGNASVYRIFLGGMLGLEKKVLEKEAKSALDEYVKAYGLCGNDKTCSEFVAKNIDWLTRMPPEKGSGGGMGNLFDQSSDGSDQSQGSGQDGEKKSPVYIPGVASGQSIRGAH